MNKLEQSIIKACESFFKEAQHCSQHVDYSPSERNLAELAGLSNDKYMRSEMVSALTKLYAFYDLALYDSGLSEVACKELNAIYHRAAKLKRVDAFKQYEDNQKERPVIGNILSSAT